MIIKQASDLHFTYVRNTPELREAFINKCKEFGIEVFGLGGENYLEVYSDGYDEFEICGTDNLEPQSKELTMVDLTDIPTETPEEKEVLDGIESAGEVEWKSGDLLEFNGEPCVFIGDYNGIPVVRYTENADTSLAGCLDEIYAVDRLKKPETPQQREECERLKAAEELYYAYMSHWDFKPNWEVLDETNRNAFLTIVDKTNYRKEKTHGTN